MKKQILVLEKLGIEEEIFEDMMKKAGLSFDVIWNSEIAEDEKVEVIITVKTRVDKDLLEKYPNTRMIAVAFTGYDCVDLETCREKDIAAYNVPAYSSNSVAELAVSFAISVLRDIPNLNNAIRKGEWNAPPGQDLNEKTVGILGTGGIGTLTGKLFSTFGCKVIGWSRSKQEEFKKYGSYTSSLAELMSQSDIVSIHLPLNEKTKGIIGRKELSKMKQSAILINTARGPIIDEESLISALEEEKIAGAALDVFDQEPIRQNNPLLEMKNVILTPHIAYKTKEALLRRSDVTVKNIANFLKQGKENRVA